MSSEYPLEQEEAAVPANQPMEDLKEYMTNPIAARSDVTHSSAAHVSMFLLKSIFV